MAKNTIYDYSTSAGSNTDIAGIGILGTNAVNNFDDAFRTIMAQIAADVSPRRMSIQGALYGLTLANNAGDAVNDIDIAVGMATTDSTTDPRTMVLASALTKRLDAAWAVGTNNGGLDTGSIANTTYHVWLIQRSDTGVVDALFSASATSPTMPTNYDRKRRIGSILRESASIVAFSQFGDEFYRSVRVQDVSVVSAPASAVTRTLSVPTGIVVEALGVAQIITTTLTASSRFFLITSLDQTDSDPGVVGGTVSQSTLPLGSSASQRATGPFRTKTNTSAQVRSRVDASAASIQIVMNTEGWVDLRGRV